MASIEQLMVTHMITARPDESVADVAHRMATNRVGAVLVVDGGRLVGLFSERDLLTRVVGSDRRPDTTPVGAMATPDPITIQVDAPLRSVIEVFRQRKFRHLPVMQNGRPVGILSTRDFLEYLVDGFERYIDQVQYQRELAQGVDPYDHIGGSYGR